MTLLVLLYKMTVKVKVCNKENCSHSVVGRHGDFQENE